MQPLPRPGSPGEATRPPTEGTPLCLPRSLCHIWASTSQSVPVVGASCTTGSAGGGVGGEPASLGKVGATCGRGGDLPPVPPRLGLGAWVPARRGIWGAGRRRLSSKSWCPGEGSGHVPGTGRFGVPSSDPTFAFHVVVHLKLHLAGPEEVAVGDSRRGSGDSVRICPRDAGYWGRSGQGAGALGAGFSGVRMLGRKSHISLPARRDVG